MIIMKEIEFREKYVSADNLADMMVNDDTRDDVADDFFDYLTICPDNILIDMYNQFMGDNPENYIYPIEDIDTIPQLLQISILDLVSMLDEDFTTEHDCFRVADTIQSFDICMVRRDMIFEIYDYVIDIVTPSADKTKIADTFKVIFR